MIEICDSTKKFLKVGVKLYRRKDNWTFEINNIIGTVYFGVLESPERLIEGNRAQRSYWELFNYWQFKCIPDSEEEEIL